MSLKNEIYNLIKNRYPDSVSGHEIEAFALKMGYNASNGSRRARELTQDKNSTVRRLEGKYASYKYEPITEILKKPENKENQLFTYKVHDPITNFRDVP